MGSFNDLVVGMSRVGDEIRWRGGAQEANDRLDELRGKAHEIADAIKRNRGAR